MAGIAKTADIPEGERLCVDFEGEKVAIFNVDGTFYALSDMCPHAGGPLSEGFIENGKVSCPWHGWSFDLDPEKTEAPNDMLCKYRVTVSGEELCLEKVE